MIAASSMSPIAVPPWTNVPVRSALLSIVVLLASGCSTIDSFGGRATTVNAATSDSKSRSILLNIMRAAHREPLQFSDVSTVAGSGQLNASLLTNAPIKISPTSAARVLALNPTIGATGSNQFNITNLNTQEFYQGIQTPISLQQMSNLVDIGYDPTLVLFLTVSELQVTTIENGKPLYVIIRNDTEDPNAIGAVYQAFKNMVDQGFSEQPTDGDAYGPVMTAAEAQNSRFVAAILGSAGTDLTLKKSGDDYFQFVKKGGYASCFDVMKGPAIGAESKKLADNGLGDASKFYRAVTDQERFNGSKTLILGTFTSKVTKADLPVRGLSIQIPVEKLCGYAGKAPPLDAGKGPIPSFKLKMRSVEGIFQFLGTIARRQTNLDRSGANTLTVGSGTFAFLAQKGDANGSGVEVWLHEQPYFVARDAAGNNKSTEVLQILTDLLALQSSAKNIPSPGLITVIGR